jgi:hypothetical protein
MLMLKESSFEVEKLFIELLRLLDSILVKLFMSKWPMTELLLFIPGIAGNCYFFKNLGTDSLN